MIRQCRIIGSWSEDRFVGTSPTTANEPQWIWPRTMTPATISKTQAENLELYQQKYPRKLLMADISVQGDYFSQPVLTFFRFLCRTYIMNHNGDTT